MTTYARKSHLQRHHGRACMDLLNEMLKLVPEVRPGIPETALHNGAIEIDRVRKSTVSREPELEGPELEGPDIPPDRELDNNEVAADDATWD